MTDFNRLMQQYFLLQDPKTLWKELITRNQAYFGAPDLGSSNPETQQKEEKKEIGPALDSSSTKTSGALLKGDEEGSEKASHVTGFPAYTETFRTFENPLSFEQKKVVKTVMQGYNVYIGGYAGTGKSFLLRFLAEELALKNLRVAKTAITGVAACNIEGITLQHAFGYSLEARMSMRQYDVVIIDEVSMMSWKMLEKFDKECRVARKLHALPFGGIQMILSGDFFAARFHSRITVPLPFASFHETFCAWEA